VNRARRGAILGGIEKLLDPGGCRQKGPRREPGYVEYETGM